MFCTVLSRLKSPTNIGMIVRTHVALGGREILFAGYDRPWQFGKASQAFSRKLESLCEIAFIRTDDELFAWTGARNYSTVALEIHPTAVPLPAFRFPERTALIVGNEGAGLCQSLLIRCDHTVVVPQFGPAECLNVAVSCSIALYELRRGATGGNTVRGSKFVLPDAQQSSAPEAHAAMLRLLPAQR
jgi:23S rRNA (guanosine2251-2'-O)-methyltransferase